MMKMKIKISKSAIKLYLFKQLKKVPGLNLNDIIHPRRLTSTCTYPKTQSIDKRNSNVNFITNHESDLTDVDRYILENFPSLAISDNESSSIDTSTKQSPTSREEFSSSTSNSLVVPSSATSDIREGDQAGVPVVTISTDPYKDFKRSMQTMLKAYNAGKYQPLDQDILNELLLCYLEQNEKRMHKHVLRAFNDITNEINKRSLKYEQENSNGKEAAKGGERGDA